MQLVIGSTYESSRGFGRLLYLGETHGIDGYLPTFRTTKGEFKHYSYDQLPGAIAEFAAPTVSRADELIACLEGEIAKRDARIVELESQYQRDVYGLNNEGDPIGGEPAGGYANDNARLRAELAAIKAQGVVMPERWNVPRPMWKDARQPYGNPLNHADIEAAEKFNLALDEVARLNAAPVQQVSVPDGKVCVPVEVLRLYEFMAASFTPFTSQHEQIAISLRKAKAAMLASTAAPAADAGLVLEQAMYALIGIGYHENSGLVHELRQSLAAHRAKGVV